RRAAPAAARRGGRAGRGGRADRSALDRAVRCGPGVAGDLAERPRRSGGGRPAVAGEVDPGLEGRGGPGTGDRTSGDRRIARGARGPRAPPGAPGWSRPRRGPALARVPANGPLPAPPPQTAPRLDRLRAGSRPPEGRGAALRLRARPPRRRVLPLPATHRRD